MNISGRILVENRIEVDNDTYMNEYQYVFGEKSQDKVFEVTYYNFKFDRVHTINIKFTYNEAMKFARYRRSDGRYKNFEFWIDRV